MDKRKNTIIGGKILSVSPKLLWRFIWVPWFSLWQDASFNKQAVTRCKVWCWVHGPHCCLPRPSVDQECHVPCRVWLSTKKINLKKLYSQPYAFKFSTISFLLFTFTFSETLPFLDLLHWLNRVRGTAIAGPSYRTMPPPRKSPSAPSYTECAPGPA